MNATLYRNESTYLGRLLVFLRYSPLLFCFYIFTVWSISSIWAEQFLRNARNCVRHRTKRCACAGFTERETELVWIMNINTLTPLIVIRRYFVFLSNCFIIIFLEINTIYACHFTVIMVRFNKNEKKKKKINIHEIVSVCRRACRD